VGQEGERVNELLDRIERELMRGVRRRVDRRRARRRIAVLGAIALAALALASAASAVSGIGPAAGLFDAEESIPPSREPEPGGRLALLHAGEGSDGWDLLFYRSEPPRFGAPVRQYCMALDNSTHCEHPLTLAARLTRKRIELSGPGAPLSGLVLGDAERVTVTQEGDAPVEAELSPPIVMKLPPLTEVQLRDLNRRQRRMAAGLPRSLTVRVFLAALDVPEVPVGQRTPVVTVRATFAGGGSVTRRTGGQLVRPEPKPVPLEERFGTPRVRLVALGPDGRRWEAVGLAGRRGVIGASATIAPWDYGRGSLFGGTGYRAGFFLRRGLLSEVSDQLPGGKRSPGSAAIYGLVRADARSIVFTRGGERPVRAKLSPVFATAPGKRRSLGLRLFLAVAPSSEARRLDPRVTLEGGRVL
jgi:hypothetical protein